MRNVGVVTVGRSDYGIYRPILRQIQEDPDLNLQLFVSGMHLSSRYGNSMHLIESDGFSTAATVEMLIDSDTPLSISQSIGQGVIGFSNAYEYISPDILVVLGDRFEMFSAALAALPFNIPVAHIHGGELTKGAFDDALRHCMTKLSHIHFVSTKPYAKRVIQLGEEPWRVIISGAPGLDNIDMVDFLPRNTLEELLKIDLTLPTLLVTFHPVTLEQKQTKAQIMEVLNAIDESCLQAIFTMPNADTGRNEIADEIRRFVINHPNARLADNLGTQVFFSLMKFVSAMVGNSSSGIIEAPSFELPVVNIGLRQDGRIRGKNVIDVRCMKYEILNGIKYASTSNFKNSLHNLINPYKQRKSTEIIVNKLKSVIIDEKLLMKSFFDIQANFSCKPEQ